MWKLVCAAILIAAGSLVFWQLSKAPQDVVELPVIGEVLEAQGDVQTRLPRQTNWQNPQAPQPLHHQEVLRTGPGSRVIVRLNTKLQFELSENTRAVGEIPLTAPQKINLQILEGNLLLREAGDAGRTFVYRDGKILNPEDMRGPTPETIDENIALQQNNEAPGDINLGDNFVIATTTDEETRPVVPKVLPKKKKPGVLDSLSRDEISSRLRSQTGFVRKCYLGYVTRAQRQEARGSVVMSFIIQPSGKVSEAKVLRKAFGDPTLERCLSEVMERTSFRSFEAKPIRLEYPIQFD